LVIYLLIHFKLLKAAQLEEENEGFRRRLQAYEPAANDGGGEEGVSGSEGAGAGEE